MTNKLALAIPCLLLLPSCDASTAGAIFEGLVMGVASAGLVDSGIYLPPNLPDATYEDSYTYTPATNNVSSGIKTEENPPVNCVSARISKKEGSFDYYRWSNGCGKTVQVWYCAQNSSGLCDGTPGLFNLKQGSDSDWNLVKSTPNGLGFVVCSIGSIASSSGSSYVPWRGESSYWCKI